MLNGRSNVNTELATDPARQAELGKEKGGKVAQNVAAAVVGTLLFAPALFLMDFQGSVAKFGLWRIP